MGLFPGRIQGVEQASERQDLIAGVRGFVYRAQAPEQIV